MTLVGEGAVALSLQRRVDRKALNPQIVLTVKKQADQLKVTAPRFRDHVCRSPASQLLESVLEANRPMQAQQVPVMHLGVSAGVRIGAQIKLAPLVIDNRLNPP